MTKYFLGFHTIWWQRSSHYVCKWSAHYVHDSELCRDKEVFIMRKSSCVCGKEVLIVRSMKYVKEVFTVWNAHCVWSARCCEVFIMCDKQVFIICDKEVLIVCDKEMLTVYDKEVLIMCEKEVPIVCDKEVIIVWSAHIVKCSICVWIAHY